MYACRIEADSIAQGVRLTTMVITMPLLYWPEVLTHRDKSRNSASQRAIPAAKQIEAVKVNPFVPETFYRESRGMVPKEPLSPEEQSAAVDDWMYAREQCLDVATDWLGRGINHEHINRLLTPWLWTTAIITATEWKNFFDLRTAPDAADPMRKIATMMRDAYDAGTPQELKPGEWHLPFIQSGDRDGYGPAILANLSAARCARVSYLTHDGKRDIDRDLDLADNLIADEHMSPLEHAARVVKEAYTLSNFRYPWQQWRKDLEALT